MPLDRLRAVAEGHAEVERHEDMRAAQAARAASLAKDDYQRWMDDMRRPGAEQDWGIPLDDFIMPEDDA